MTNQNVESKLDYLLELAIQKTSDTENFKYHNVNPKNLKTEDCVIRAIATALGKSWDDVLTEMFKCALEHKHPIHCTTLIDIYLGDRGWIKNEQPRDENGYVFTLEEWLKYFENEAIIHVGNDHVTYANNGIVYDTWNCTDRLVDVFWTKKEE